MSNTTQSRGGSAGGASEIVDHPMYGTDTISAGEEFHPGAGDDTEDQNDDDTDIESVVNVAERDGFLEDGERNLHEVLQDRVEIPKELKKLRDPLLPLIRDFWNSDFQGLDKKTKVAVESYNAQVYKRMKDPGFKGDFTIPADAFAVEIPKLREILERRDVPPQAIRAGFRQLWIKAERHGLTWPDITPRKHQKLLTELVAAHPLELGEAQKYLSAPTLEQQGVLQETSALLIKFLDDPSKSNEKALSRLNSSIIEVNGKNNLPSKQFVVPAKDLRKMIKDQNYAASTEVIKYVGETQDILEDSLGKRLQELIIRGSADEDVKMSSPAASPPQDVIMSSPSASPAQQNQQLQPTESNPRPSKSDHSLLASTFQRSQTSRPDDSDARPSKSIRSRSQPVTVPDAGKPTALYKHGNSPAYDWALQPETVGWRNFRGVTYINRFGPLREAIYRIQDEPVPLGGGDERLPRRSYKETADNCVNTPPFICSKDSSYRGLPTHSKADFDSIYGVAVPGESIGWNPVDWINPDLPGTWRDFSLIYVGWHDGTFTWETRTAVRKLFKVQRRADLMIYDACRRAQETFEKWMQKRGLEGQLENDDELEEEPSRGLERDENAAYVKVEKARRLMRDESVQRYLDMESTPPPVRQGRYPVKPSVKVKEEESDSPRWNVPVTSSRAASRAPLQPLSQASTRAPSARSKTPEAREDFKAGFLEDMGVLKFHDLTRAQKVEYYSLLREFGL